MTDRPKWTAFPCCFQVMVEKDSLIQEAAGENNGLKEQLRSVLIQTDDLHAEKAKLAAELHGYRDQLKQVLSLKDSQHKQQLAAQRERMNALEKERRELESQLAAVGNGGETQEKADRVEREPLSQAAAAAAAAGAGYAPGAEVEKLREQLQAARSQVEAVEETLQKERKEQESKSRELAHLQWEGGVMRTESETAQERVAELARDLLAVEQKLMEEKEVTAQLGAENESFTKAMVSLQESRDQAVDKVQELTLKVAELSKAGGHGAQSTSAGSTGEVWGLKNALQALQNDRERLVSKRQKESTPAERCAHGAALSVCSWSRSRRRRPSWTSRRPSWPSWAPASSSRSAGGFWTRKQRAGTCWPSSRSWRAWRRRAGRRWKRSGEAATCGVLAFRSPGVTLGPCCACQAGTRRLDGSG